MRIKRNILNITRNRHIKIKNLAFLLFLFLIPNLFIIFLSTNFKFSKLNLEIKKDIIPDIKKLKSSKISGPIYIDDTDPNNNWTVAYNAGICTGSGNYSDPYIIEDFIIDGNNLSSCIIIENSKKFFKIVNCIVFNSIPGGYYAAGISLQQTSNGTLINNNCSNNNGNGISLINSNNITITGNNVSYNDERGIYLSDVQYNLVSDNIVSNNWKGIDLLRSDNNFITDNNVYYNAVGIKVSESDNNTFFENTIAFSTSDGFSTLRSNFNNISENDITNNEFQGINMMDYSNNNTVTNNILKSNQGSGIAVFLNMNLTISGNTLEYNGINVGSIDISYSNNTKILNNIIRYSEWAGIQIQKDSYSNILSGNEMEGCGLMIHGTLEALVSHYIDNTNRVNDKFLYYVINKQGLFQYDFDLAGQIILINCTDSIIANSDISYGTTAISLQFCQRIQILNMKCSYNFHAGIYLNFCNDCSISGSIITMNEVVGITISDSTHNSVHENNITKNFDGLYLYESNNNTITRNNISRNNANGIMTRYSHYNIISNNTINQNTFIGINLMGSNFNQILENDLRYNSEPYTENNCLGNIFRDNILQDPSNGALEIPIENSILLAIIIISIIAIIGILIQKKKIISI